jgi:uncharacterized protein with PIN domain
MDIPYREYFLGRGNGPGGRHRARRFALALDNTLQPLARKLRMVGIDAAVAGEVLRGLGRFAASENEAPNTLERILVDLV